MREFKFRAWDLVTKTMQEVPTIFYSCGKELKMVKMNDNRRYEFMQFIGLKDKNGKEIYEGDIVIVDDNGEYFPHEYNEEKDEFCPCGKYFVKYDSEYARFILIDLETNLEVECDFNPFSLPDIELGVIGNIYEKFEPLRGGSNDC